MWRRSRICRAPSAPPSRPTGRRCWSCASRASLRGRCSFSVSSVERSCPCDSGKKFKKCCLGKERSADTEARVRIDSAQRKPLAPITARASRRAPSAPHSRPKTQRRA
ncbi:MAG: hypothetical protein DMD81_13200 [Candidatus Rokuibacteriota bacterium]|nr:MAG: hypothetical protein DMD81_13200 [Candidatus Rokubacteria bacterium]